MFDFFEGRELVRPAVTMAEAQTIATDLFGLVGPTTVTELGSQQDRNFRIDHTDVDGVTSYLLKVDNALFSEQELSAQGAAMEHLAGSGLRIPTPIAGVDGRTRQYFASPTGPLPVRMFSFLHGGSLAEVKHFDTSVIGELGEISATVARALATFPVDGLDRTLQWDLRNAHRVIRHLIGSVPDAARSATLSGIAAEAAERVARVAGALRVQPIHGDVTDDNVICARQSNGRLMPDGVIDFGDLGLGWLVAELAVTTASVLHHVPDEPFAVFEVVRRFNEVLPLTDEEIAVIWPLVVLRGAVLVVSGEHQTSIEAGNSYAEERMGLEWEVFAAASRIGWDEAEAMIRWAIGRPTAERSAAEPAAGASLIRGLRAEAVEVLDLGTTSPMLNDGRWLDADVEWALALGALDAHGSPDPVIVAPYGQYRLTRSTPDLQTEPATFSLIAELFLTAGSELCAPMAGEIVRVVGDEVVLGLMPGRHGQELVVSGISVSASLASGGATVAAGTTLGQVNPVGSHRTRRGEAVGRVRAQLRSVPDLSAPDFVTPTRAPAWVSLTADPAALIGLAPADTTRGAASVGPTPDSTRAPVLDDPQNEVDRRARIFAAAQERYYEHPPQIERGWKQHLIATDGRCYLDMVNNVAGIGHAHPQLSRAVFEQMQLLNTNSRFLYRALADLSERLVELAPDPSLDTVLLVNSGSEAVDLALRLARIHTGRSTVVALREAYHGWTMASDAVTTSAYDNPYALANRPDWVVVADVPNTYRGAHRGADAGARYRDDFTAQLEALGERQADLAAFICEPVLGNAGGVMLPDGYLAGVYSDVRERGGLCIADEVQVGYGRLGTHFWGVEQQGVVPDIITIAKAMGNSYPIGAVLTRKDIAESLAREGNFFSSAGGSPVGSVAGLAVLNVMRDEGLQENARVVGAHLVSRVQNLMERHPLIGAVHGLGLYLGIELVRDRVSLEPADAETAAICERMRQRGVIVQPTSERQNVLKVKPPLCLTLASADFFVDQLDEVLSSGW
ncbi:aminotransferase [Glaciibacter psychrotolerans]|uniref:4-aminobutyrate aminotransferase-like enzyme/Ser/Thr protein kinase RdoA (MazF antagonist) n=1 Tax=Glaciibacter psychrotolerans TaxID=670054 RepID=A0A7Z0EHF4_9MICO|nr:4-aminobutyrate aminotransferase-like enzyme/Ser/Thr protein kinase RdoA (MazF antagonist) [Leifsonia psychrotolerans]